MKKLLFIPIFLLSLTTAWAGITNFNPTGDAIIRTGAPTTNQNNINAPFFNFATNDGYIMIFNTSSLAGQTATHAYLNLWTNRGDAHNNNLYRILRTVSATQVTYNIYSTSNNWATAGALGSGTDYTTTNSATYVMQGGSGAYYQADVTAMVNDCLTAGGNCIIEWRESGAFFDEIAGMASTNPPILTVQTGTPGTPTLWYVRDGGAAYGQTAATCNGSVNAINLSGSAGPNCAVSHPKYILGDADNTSRYVGGDIIYINGDSDTAYSFTVNGVTNRPSPGDTYTNNGHTYTVTVSLPTGLSSGKISMDGAGLAPQASGTLTRTSGSGDATITFSAEAAAQALYPMAKTFTNPLQGGIAGQQTKLIGTGTNYPQIWWNGGSGSLTLNLMLDTRNGYIDLENLDLTTHNNCIKNGPNGTSPNPDGYNYVCNSTTDSWLNTGVQVGGTGNTFTNLLVHGFNNGMNNSVSGGVVGDNTFTNVKIFGNNSEGLSIGQGQATDNVMTGTMKFVWSQVDFNGCGQRYPLQDATDLFQDNTKLGFSHSVRNESNYYNCFGQDQGGYGDGIAFGPNGNANAGNWVLINTDVSFNTQDGLDSLHGNGNGTVSFLRSIAEGNAGQQIKLNGQIEDIENSIINGDCQRWSGASESSTTLGSTSSGGTVGFVMSSHGVCRAEGDVMVMFISRGSQTYFYNNTVSANGIPILAEQNTLSSTGCDSTTGLHIKNNIINGGAYSAYNHVIGYNGSGNDQLVPYIYLGGSDGNGTGTCGKVGNGTGGVVVPDEDYNIVYNTKNNNQGCNGAHDHCGTSPGFSSTILMGTLGGALNTFYTGNQMWTLESLASTSGARNGGNTTGLTYTNGIADFNNFTPVTVSPLIDDGALQYGSVPSFCSGIGISCTTNGNCCSGFCSAGACVSNVCGDGIVTSTEVCDGSNLNSQTCQTQGFNSGTLSCAGDCLSFVTSSCSGSCTANAGACSVDGNCCSGFCVSSVCAAYKCGDGIVTPPEVCDGANLNSNTCSTVGSFTGGTLACNANCLSFNTSSCSAQNGVNLFFSGSIGAS